MKIILGLVKPRSGELTFDGTTMLGLTTPQIVRRDSRNVDHRAYLPEGGSRDTVPIDVIALDDYFRPGDRVDLIKLDVQGYELHALRGANRVLHDNPAAKLILEL